MTLVLRLLAVAVVAGLGLPFKGTIQTFVNPAPAAAPAIHWVRVPVALHNGSFRYDGLPTPGWTRLAAAGEAEADAQEQADFSGLLDAAVIALTPPPPAPEPLPAPAAAPLPVPRAAPAAAAPLPAAPAPEPASGSVPDLIRSVFAAGGQSAVDWALRVAKCESGYNPNAYNPSSGASGVFQFLPSTWRGTPYASSSIFDAGANVRAALWLYQRSGPNQWSCA